jgi:hypothetical protein
MMWRPVFWFLLHNVVVHPALGVAQAAAEVFARAHHRTARAMGAGTRRERSDLTACARCGSDHRGLWWEELVRPVLDREGVEWSWWAACPSNGQPILMRVSK